MHLKYRRGDEDLYRLAETRGWLLFGIAITLSSGLALGGATRPASGATQVMYFGVNMHPLQDTYSVYSPSQTLRLAREIGASVVRIDINWGWIEYNRPGSKSWYVPQIQQLDTFLATAARLHIRVLATVLSTPCWASNEPGKKCPPDPPRYHGNYPPANPRDYATFLMRLVHHVGQKIQYYEVWNEPNLTRSWVHPDPVAYTRLLQVAYRAIKTQDPGAQVLAGATSGADVNFVDGMYQAGARGYFDALSVHPYSGSRSPWVCTPLRQSFRCGVEQIRRVMLRHGDTRPIWLTEFGESVSAGVGPRPGTAWTRLAGGSPADQAGYVTQAFSLIRRWSYVRGAVWYELYDDPTGHDGQHFGLFEGTLCPRPAASAFRSSTVTTKSATAALRCPPSVSAPGSASG